MRRPGNGRPIDSKVFRPITMGFLIEPLGFGAPYALAAVCYAVSMATSV